MARIAGVNIPDNKHAVISLTYIYGVGRSQARRLCADTGVAENAKIGELSEEQMDALRAKVSDMTVDCAIAVGCPCAVSAPKPMPVPARVRASRFASRVWTAES
jgi:ribosomal protein S13